MKVSELSRRSGVSLPTIKFYIREGLLPAGESTGKNQAEYSEEHFERLALIRSLREDAALSVEVIARALRAADSARTDFVVAAIDAIQRPQRTDIDERSAEFRQCHAEILELCNAHGWQVTAADTSVGDAARALTVIQRSFPQGKDEDLTVYADAAQRLAQHEIPDGWQPDAAPNAALRYAVLGTMLFEPFILALRRVAHVGRARRVIAVAQKSRAKPGPVVASARRAKAGARAKRAPVKKRA
jgi:DNA-binding transcriptional MerR regulator